MSDENGKIAGLAIVGASRLDPLSSLRDVRYVITGSRVIVNGAAR